MKNCLLIVLIVVSAACKNQKAKENQAQHSSQDSLKSCCSSLPNRFQANAGTPEVHESDGLGQAEQKGMVFIPGGEFVMGGDSLWGREDEFPLHPVKVASF